MTDTNTFTVQIQVSYNDLWDAIWGSDGAGMDYWCDQVRDWDGNGIHLWKDGEANPQAFQIHDYQEDKWHKVSLDDLAKAYELALTQGLTHCGHYKVTDLDDSDACTGDLLIQLAVFKDVIYG